MYTVYEDGMLLMVVRIRDRSSLRVLFGCVKRVN